MDDGRILGRTGLLLSMVWLCLACSEDNVDGPARAVAPPEAERSLPGGGSGQAARQAFETVMQQLAEGWNTGDARLAAQCFTEDAVYSEPPAKQLFQGREQLFQFFGGEEGREGTMTMEWHHLAYDPESNIGFGEFTFAFGSAAHGVVVVRLRDGKIANWREYLYESDLSWEEFTASNPF